MGEINNKPPRLEESRRLKLESHGAKVTSDAGEERNRPEAAIRMLVYSYGWHREIGKRVCGTKKSRPEP